MDTAWELSNSILDSARQLQDPDCIAKLLRILGNVARQHGDFEQAKSFCVEALDRVKQANYLNGIADSLFDLGKVEMEMGQNQPARQNLLDALDTYRKLGAESRVQESKVLLAKLNEPITDTKGEGTAR